MATYKKHSDKRKKSRSEKIEQRSSTAKFFNRLDIGVTLFEDWVARNRKPILTIIGAVIIAVLGYLTYNNLVIKPKQEQAVKEMSVSMTFFNRAMQVAPGPNQDTLLIRSLHGAGSYGLLDIIDNYSGTDAANIAHYVAGMAYLKLGQYKEAIAQLEQFSSDDQFYPAIAKGAIGDAFRGNDQPELALKYYLKAAHIRTNDFTTPKYLLKAATTAMDLGKTEKATNLLNQIKEEYPDSPEAIKVPAYLGMAKTAQ